MQKGVDEAFFASVLQKWSEAELTNVNLRAKLRECQCAIREITPSSVPTISQCLEDEDNTTIAKLREAEGGLERARNEYQRLKEQLHASDQQMQIILAENKELKLGRVDSITSRQELLESLAKSEADAARMKVQNNFLQEKISDLSREKAEKEMLIEQLRQGTQGNDDSAVNRNDVERLKAEVKNMKESAKSNAAENQMLRNELKTTQDNLHKMKDSNKTLLETINKLQNLTRAPQYPQTVKRQPSHSNTSVLSHAKEVHTTSTLTPKTFFKTSTQRRSRSSQPPQSDKGILDLTECDGVPMTGKVTMTKLPRRRQQEIASFPVVIPDVDDLDQNSFSRDVLRKALGGASQSLIVRVTDSQTDLSRSKQITCYLCPSLEHNPWCPSTPGQHGYLFVGLGKEKDTFLTPESRNVFIGIKDKCRSRRSYTYLGFYSVARVKPLSADEWADLPSKTKDAYVDVTIAKAKDKLPGVAVKEAYDTGLLSVPCVRLQCIGFDNELYNALVKTRSATPTGSHGKRGREDGEGEGSLSQKKRWT